MTIDIQDVPQLETEVAIRGGSKQVEVGGPICASILVGIGLFLTGKR